MLSLILCCLLPALWANDLPDPGSFTITKELPQGLEISAARTVPAYTFTRNPTPLMTSYYDYMIGSFNNMPLKEIPQSEGGGYMITYHARRTATGMRRAFFAHLSPEGLMMINSEISANQANEGYPALAFDPVSGKPLYAWHVNYDADIYLEDIFISDVLLGGVSGLFGDL